MARSMGKEKPVNLKHIEPKRKKKKLQTTVQVYVLLCKESYELKISSLYQYCNIIMIHDAPINFMALPLSHKTNYKGWFVIQSALNLNKFPFNCSIIQFIASDNYFHTVFALHISSRLLISLGKSMLALGLVSHTLKKNSLHYHQPIYSGSRSVPWPPHLSSSIQSSPREEVISLFTLKC